MFSIFKLKKIAQTGLKLDIQKLFYTKSSTQIPMSWSIFSNRIVWKILETKVESYQCVETLSKFYQNVIFLRSYKEFVTSSPREKTVNCPASLTLKQTSYSPVYKLFMLMLDLYFLSNPYNL